MTSFSELLDLHYSSEKFRTGAIIKGEVLRLDGEEVVIDAGMKAEAYVPIDHFKDLDGNINVQPGEFYDLYVETPVRLDGSVSLSRERAQRIEMWQRLEEAMEKEEILTGLVTDKVKGGLRLDIGQVRAFLPRSLVDIRQPQDLSEFEGQHIPVKIVKIDQERNNLVVSRRAVVEEESLAEREALLSNLNEGDVVEGIVKNLTDYGAFIDMGGTDGLLHITDMAWRRVNHPSEILAIGDTIEVKVLKFDRERFRVSLGIKQLSEDPWKVIEEKYAVGSIIHNAKVANITDYGAFVALEDAVDGLVHTSELDWTNRNIHPNKVVSIGQEVSVKILDIDSERRRVSLSIKQCQDNPWQAFGMKFQRGDTLKGQIRSITDFGLFVGLEGGIDGLVHLTDLVWDEDAEAALRDFKKGDEIEVMVLSIDIDRERISLGVKQLTPDAFMSYISEYGKGSVVEGKVLEKDEKGGYSVSLAEGVVALLRHSEVEGNLSEGDTVRAALYNIDKKNRKLVISMKNLSDIEEKQAVRDYQKASRAEASGHEKTLGSLLGSLDTGKEDIKEEPQSEKTPEEKPELDAVADAGADEDEQK